MTIFIKYPINKGSLHSCRSAMFFVCNKIASTGQFLVAYTPTSVDEKGKVIYPPDNKTGVYSKSLMRSELITYKGGVTIESCEFHERITLARKWYFDSKQKLPRKTKKKLISTRKKARKCYELFVGSMNGNYYSII